LQQLLKRYKEIENVTVSLKHNYSNHKQYACKYLHNNGPIILDDYNVTAQYLQISNDKFYIDCRGYNNNCCLLKNGLCILIINIVENNIKDIFFIGKKLKT